MTQVDSNLNFTAQSASVSNYDVIEIVNQNFGFDLSAGIDSVVLDTAVPHYYMEVERIVSE